MKLNFFFLNFSHLNIDILFTVKNSCMTCLAVLVIGNILNKWRVSQDFDISLSNLFIICNAK